MITTLKLRFSASEYNYLRDLPWVTGHLLYYYDLGLNLLLSIASFSWQVFGLDFAKEWMFMIDNMLSCLFVDSEVLPDVNHV